MANALGREVAETVRTLRELRWRASQPRPVVSAVAESILGDLDLLVREERAPLRSDDQCLHREVEPIPLPQFSEALRHFWKQTVRGLHTPVLREHLKKPNGRIASLGQGTLIDR
jgi:hypothetical protein